MNQSVIIKHFCKWVLFILGLIFFSCYLHAADIKRINSNTLRLVGEIEVGDSIKLEKLLKDIQREDDAPVPYGRSIELNSKGGVFIEGIRIGYLLREYVVEAHVKSGSICLSSCALAFLGGSFQFATSGPVAGRFLELGGIIGFHGFYIDPSAEKALQKSYLSAFLGVELSKVMASILAGYAADMNIRSEWINKSLAKGKNELYMINTIGDALDLEIRILDLPPISVIDNSYAVNACNAATGDIGWKNDGSAKVRKLSSIEAKRLILEHLSETLLGGFVLTEIRNALASNDSTRIYDMYKELEHLTSVGAPLIDLDRKVIIYHVDESYLRMLTGCIMTLEVKGGRIQSPQVVFLRTFGISEPYRKWNFLNEEMMIYDRSQLLSELKMIRNNTR